MSESATIRERLDDLAAAAKMRTAKITRRALSALVARVGVDSEVYLAHAGLATDELRASIPEGKDPRRLIAER